jgi:hypothetical protein
MTDLCGARIITPIRAEVESLSNIAPWGDLEREVKAYDYNLVKAIPGLLKEIGVELRRLAAAPSAPPE